MGIRPEWNGKVSLFIRQSRHDAVAIGPRLELDERLGENDNKEPQLRISEELEGRFD